MQKTVTQDIRMINVGTSYATSQSAVALAERYETGVWAAIGLHPMYAGAEFIKMKSDPNEGEFLPQDFEKEKYVKLAGSKKVVAIGEIGLEYDYKPKGAAKLAEFKAKQKEVLLQQLDLAQELNLPVILHCRMAHQDLLEILNSKFEIRNSKLHGVVHCFT